MKQTTRVLNYMQQNGSITSLEAFRDLGVTRLSGVIFILRKTHAIGARKEKSCNRYGERTSYSRYYLKEGAEDEA